MKWRNVDKILPDYGAPCVVKGIYRIVRHDHYNKYWRLMEELSCVYRSNLYKEWLYYDEVLELIEESEDE